VAGSEARDGGLVFLLREGDGLTYIEELQDVIRRLHGVAATHVKSVPVKETFRGTTAWEGIVEVYSTSAAIPKRREYMRGRMTQTTQANQDSMLLFCIFFPLCRQQWQYGQQLCRSSRAVNQQKKPKKVGKAKLPKGEAEGKIVTIRFAKAEFERLSRKAEGSGESISEWIRSTLLSDLEG
jgi:hypothetical protein